MMKTMSKTGFRFAICCITAIGVCLIAGGQIQAAPVVMQATASSSNGTLKGVVLNSDLTTTLNAVGTADFDYNNMGWRSADGLLWAVELTQNGNTGNVVMIDPVTGLLSGSKISISGLPTGTRWDAGDVNNDLDALYISQRSAPGDTFYTLDLNTLSLSSLTVTGTAGGASEDGYVADWAYVPAGAPGGGLLYGVDITGELAVLNPSTGIRSDSAVSGGLPGGVAFGAAWYDPVSGDIFVYRNEPTVTPKSIYQIDPSTATRINAWSAVASPRHDGAYVVPIPGAAVLLGSGLIGLMIFRRRLRG